MTTTSTGRPPADGSQLPGLAEGWFDHVPEASVWVECVPGARHRITWRRGELVLDEHHAEAELALVAFGSDSCYCIDLFLAWEWVRHSLVSPSYLTAEALAGGESDELIRIEDSFVTQSPSSVFRQMIEQAGTLPAGVQERYRDHLRRQRAERILVVLPDSFHARLALTALAAMALGRSTVPDREIVPFEMLLYRNLRAAVVASIDATPGLEAAGHYNQIDCRLEVEGEPTRVEGSIGPDLTDLIVVAPWAWLFEVWVRGLAVVDGAFVLSVDRSPARAESAGGAARSEPRPADLASSGPATPQEGTLADEAVACTAVRWKVTGLGKAEPELLPAVARLVDGQWTLIAD